MDWISHRISLSCLGAGRIQPEDIPTPEIGIGNSPPGALTLVIQNPGKKIYKVVKPRYNVGVINKRDDVLVLSV